MKIITQKDIVTTKWSGGTTAELFIYPPESHYKDLDFKFRLSRATIEVESSDFTTLPKVNRKLILLEGELELIHENQHSKHLKPLQFDTFKGDWKTKCVIDEEHLPVTDFNLMMLGDTKGTYSVIKAKKRQFHHYNIVNDFTIFYVAEGNFQHEDTTLSKGELIVIENPQPQKFEFKIFPDSSVIVVRIDLNH